MHYQYQITSKGQHALPDHTLRANMHYQYQITLCKGQHALPVPDHTLRANMHYQYQIIL